MNAQARLLFASLMALTASGVGLMFPKTKALGGKRVVPLMERSPTQLTEDQTQVRAAVIHGGRMSLKCTARTASGHGVGLFAPHRVIQGHW